MPKLSPIYRFIFVLIVCILVGTPVQTQEHPDDRQNEIRNLERQIVQNERVEEEIKGRIEETPGEEERERLERELVKVRNHTRELKKELNDLLDDKTEQRRPGPTNGPPPTFIEAILNALKSPTVWAAIIGAIAAIIAALIGIKKRK